jgi:hypothetical protein
MAKAKAKVSDTATAGFCLLETLRQGLFASTDSWVGAHAELASDVRV